MNIPRSLFFIAASMLVCGLLASAPANAQKKKKSVIEEADSRFSRGVELFNDEDYAAALAEFHWAYNLKPHYAVLYNMAVCYVKMGRYLDALDYFNRYFKEGGEKIHKDREKEVHDQIDYIKSLMGGIAIKTNLDHVTIIVDGKKVAKTPLSEPVLVPAGPHTVQLAIAGYMPIEEEITVASNVTVKKEYTLVKDKRTSLVTIIASAPHATVYIDGREMGKSPWTGQLSMGEHEIKITAPGYRDAARPIVVHPDEEREIDVEMDISGIPGKLTITSKTQGADVWIEEQSIGTIPLKSFKVPPAMYHISISKEGYASWEGDISVREGATTKVDVKMDKTSGKIHPWAFSLTTSLTIASGVAAIVLGWLTLEKQDEFDNYPDDVMTGKEGGNVYLVTEKYNDLADEGRNLAIGTDVCIAATAVSGLISIFLGFYTQFKKPESKATIKIGSISNGNNKGLTLGGEWNF